MKLPFQQLSHLDFFFLADVHIALQLKPLTGRTDLQSQTVGGNHGPNHTHALALRPFHIGYFLKGAKHLEQLQTLRSVERPVVGVGLFF